MAVAVDAKCPIHALNCDVTFEYHGEHRVQTIVRVGITEDTQGRLLFKAVTADLVRLLTLFVEAMDSSWSLAWLTWVGGRCAEHSHQTWGRGWDPGPGQGGTGGGCVQ